MIIENKNIAGELTYKTVSVIKYDIDHPIMSGELSAGRINMYNKHIIDGKMRMIRGTLYNSAVKQYEIFVKYNSFSMFDIKGEYEVTYNSNRLISMFCDTYISRGAEGSVMERISQNWDLKNGKILSLGDILGNGLKWLKSCTALAYEQITMLENEMGVKCFENWQHIFSESVKRGRFYLADDGIVVWFPQGSIASNIWGIPSVMLNYSKLDGIIDKRVMS